MRLKIKIEFTDIDFPKICNYFTGSPEMRVRELISNISIADNRKEILEMDFSKIYHNVCESQLSRLLHPIFEEMELNWILKIKIVPKSMDEIFFSSLTSYLRLR